MRTGAFSWEEVSRCGERRNARLLRPDRGTGIGRTPSEIVVSSTPTHLPDMSANGRAFDIQAEFEPMGDQPRAIAELTEGLKRGDQHQTLLGATGTGKTFTISHVLQNAGMPVLVMSHNKTLAAQLYAELRSFFPDNAVEFFKIGRASCRE